MSDNNIVQFPKKKGKKSPSEINEELQKARMTLEHVNKQRKNAIEALEHKVQGLLDSEKINASFMTAEVVETLRDLRAAVNHALLALEAHDRMVDMITHDLVGTVQNVEMQAVNAFRVSTHVQVMTELLLNKGLITEAELEAKYKEVIEPVQEDIQGTGADPTIEN